MVNALQDFKELNKQ